MLRGGSGRRGGSSSSEDLFAAKIRSLRGDYEATRTARLAQLADLNRHRGSVATIGPNSEDLSQLCGWPPLPLRFRRLRPGVGSVPGWRCCGSGSRTSSNLWRASSSSGRTPLNKRRVQAAAPERQPASRKPRLLAAGASAPGQPPRTGILSSMPAARGDRRLVPARRHSGPQGHCPRHPPERNRLLRL